MSARLIFTSHRSLWEGFLVSFPSHGAWWLIPTLESHLLVSGAGCTLAKTHDGKSGFTQQRALGCGQALGCLAHPKSHSPGTGTLSPGRGPLSPFQFVTFGGFLWLSTAGSDFRCDTGKENEHGDSLRRMKQRTGKAFDSLFYLLLFVVKQHMSTFSFLLFLLLFVTRIPQTLEPNWK